jgi:DNA-binding GntR family transcriptional regulator
VQEAAEKPLPEYIAERQRLHVDLVDALDRRDRENAMRLIAEHKTTAKDDVDGRTAPARGSQTSTGASQ